MVAPVPAAPPRVILTANLLGAAARFGPILIDSVYGPSCTVVLTGPGPTWALTAPSEASAFAGGGRLDSTIAAATMPATRSTSPPTRRRSIAAVDVLSTSSPRACAATSRGTLRALLRPPNTSATASSPILTRIALPYDVSHSVANVGRRTIAAAVPLAITPSTDTIATRENRGTVTASASPRRAPAANPSTSTPARPPSQTDPATMCSQSNAHDSPA